MKFVLISLIIFIAFLTVRFTMAGQLSAERKSPGINNGQLSPCPDSPNCINTEYPDKTSHYHPPLDYPETKAEQIIPLAKKIILEMEGEIVSEKGTYLAATFTSGLFKFVDDFEVRQDDFALKLHIRSASRVGYSDFGVNKRRVEEFFKIFRMKVKN